MTEPFVLTFTKGREEFSIVLLWGKISVLHSEDLPWIFAPWQVSILRNMLDRWLERHD